MTVSKEKAPKRPKSPFAVAELDNYGYFEGRVKSIAPKENKSGNPQVYVNLEQRITRPNGSRLTYNIVLFVAFGKVAESLVRFVKPDYHLRIRYRATSFQMSGRRNSVNSLEIDRFRVYRSVEENLESWMEEGFFDNPAYDGLTWAPENGEREVP